MKIIKEYNNRYIDEIGRVIFKENGLTQLLLNGSDIDGLYSENCDELEKYNKYSKNQLKVAETIEIEEFDTERTNSWKTPTEFENLDIRSFVLEKCKTEEEKERVHQEINMYEEKQLIPLLKHLVFLIDHFRKNNVIWGIGRGSSVSSYVLYLIGVHKVNSIKYNLDIKDFLK